MCFYFVPQFIVEGVCVVAEETECFTILEHIGGRESNGTVSELFVFDERARLFIWCGISNVFKIHQCNIRAAEEVDKFLTVFFVLGIFRTLKGTVLCPGFLGHKNRPLCPAFCCKLLSSMQKSDKIIFNKNTCRKLDRLTKIRLLLKSH